ncbi:MAG: hypothetical protein H5T86_06215 [Armatimonadetes bacterium]|nr:hypothetical protein [Armatimonadota bacterium]
MNFCSFTAAVVLQVIAILLACGIVACAVGWATYDWWWGPNPPPPWPVRQWLPFRMPNTNVVVWRPAEWRVQAQASCPARIVFMGSPVAFVAVQVVGTNQAMAPAQAVEQLLSELQRRPGFWERSLTGRRLGGAQAVAKCASWWERAGLRPVAWHAEIRAARVCGALVVVSASCDSRNWPEFVPTAYAIMDSLYALPSAGGQ